MTVLMGTAPDFLDPQEGYTTQSAEATWISYLGLYTYAHKNGQPGGEVIPGLAQELPEGLLRRPHVHADPALRPEVQRRDRGQGL